MKVVLKDDTELLDEVVVVGYGAQKNGEPDRCGGFRGCEQNN